MDSMERWFSPSCSPDRVVPLVVHRRLSREKVAERGSDYIGREQLRTVSIPQSGSYTKLIVDSLIHSPVGGQTMKTCTAILILILIASMDTAMADVTGGEVSRLYPSQSGREYFRLTGDTCKTSKYWYFDFSGEQTKAWYSMLLAAGTSGKAVRISHPTCDSTQDQPIYYIYQDF